MKEDARARRVHNLADSSLDIFNVYYEKWWLNTEVMVEPRGTLHVVLEIQKYLPFKPQNFKMGSFTFFLLDFSSFKGFLNIILLTNRNLKGMHARSKTCKSGFIAMS